MATLPPLLEEDIQQLDDVLRGFLDRTDAATGGNPGASADGSALVTASAFKRPAFTCGAVAPASTITICTSPPTTAVSAGPLPVYGMAWILMPASDLNNAAESDTEPPGVVAA